MSCLKVFRTRQNNKYIWDCVHEQFYIVNKNNIRVLIQLGYMGTPPPFSAMLSKGDTFRDCLFAGGQRSLPKMGSTLKGMMEANLRDYGSVAFPESVSIKK